MPRPKKTDAHPFLIETILPAYGVHLLGGPSGAGKTTIVLQILDDWVHGRPVFGNQSHPCAWCYVAMDRGTQDTWETFDRVKPDIDENRIFSWDDDVKNARNRENLIKFAKAELPKGGFLIIDDLAALMEGDPNNAKDTRAFIGPLRKALNAYQITPLGTMHNSKAKPGEEYKAPRQQIAGSVEWGHYGSSCFLIKQVSETGPERVLYIMPRNAPDEKIPLVMAKDGRLHDPEDDIAEVGLDYKLSQVKSGDEFTKAQAVMWGTEINLALRTVELWLTNSANAGKILRTKNGVYLKTRTS